MAKVQVDKAVPNFRVEATGGKPIDLRSLRGRNVVLYFYPKDHTSGCTTEGCDFRDHHKAFTRANAVILGVSRDSLASHDKFRAKYQFPFDLLSDSDEKLCRLFDVIREKNMYGKKVMGVERSTFLIDAEGMLRRAWRKVKVNGHVEEVLAAVKSL
jgi:peroxiredoxin Q/BCP